MAVLAAGAVTASLFVYHRGEEMAARLFFSMLAATAFVVGFAFFLPFEVFPFRILVWVLCAWLGLAGSAAIGRAMYSGDDVPLACVGLLWFAEALVIGSRGAVAVRILVHGPVPWFIGAGLLFFMLLAVRAVFKHLDIRSAVLPDEGVFVLAGGVAVITAAGSCLPTAIGVYKILSWVILFWLFLFGVLLVFQDNREKRLIGLVLIGGACCVAQFNPLFSLGFIARGVSWLLTAFLILIMLYVTGHYWENDDICESSGRSILFCGLPLLLIVLLGLFLPGSVSAFKVLIPFLCVELLLTGSLFFGRGFFNSGWREALAGFCFLQGAFAIALYRKYILLLSARLGWEGSGLAAWLAFNGTLAASLALLGLGRLGFRLLSRMKDLNSEKETARLTEESGRLDSSRYYDLLELSKRNFVRVSARGVDITAIDVRIENRTRQAFKIQIVPGTCFVGTGRYQNMAARIEERFVLDALAPYSVRVSAVCVNAEKPIPSDKNAFFSLRQSSADLTRFLTRSAQEDPMVAQAGAWALTDQYSAAQLQVRLKRGDSPAISQRHIRKAKGILDELGISHSL